MMNYGYNPYNPLMNTQQRITQMEQQYPQYAPVQTASAQSMTTIPVSNIDEANAYRVDLNGTPTFFYNSGKNEVYMKRTNLQTGGADFVKFAKAAEPAGGVKTEKSINNHEKDFKALNDKIDGLAKQLNELIEHQTEPTKGGKNAK